MRRRPLGAAGVSVGELALGTMTFGMEADEPTSHSIMDTFMAAGGNLIDTADVYGPARSEEIVGRWLSGRGDDADHVLVATKFRFPMSEDLNDKGASRRHLRRALDASRRRLGRDTIDLYQVHAWDPSTPVDETLLALDDAVHNGRIDYYGFSNVTGWQLTKIIARAEALGTAKPVTLQPQYNLLVREVEYEILPAAVDAGVGLLPWGPLGGGWLTGKYRSDSAPEGPTRLGENPQRGFEAYGRRAKIERTWNVLAELRAIAAYRDTQPAHVALAWLRERAGVSSIILGARTVAQIENNLRSQELTLSREEIQRLDEVSDPQPDDYPYGERGREQRQR